MKVLLVVDVQRDFVEGGALAVGGGNAVVPVLNTYIDEFVRLGCPVIYTRDWHPKDHCSFKANGGIWPDHCVQGTPGAEFHPDLKILGTVVHKGMLKDREEYSAASSGSPLVALLSGLDATHIYVGGIATDYCVKQHVLDLLKLKVVYEWSVWCLMDAVAAVNVKPEDGHEALLEMDKAGCKFNAIKQTVEVK